MRPRSRRSGPGQLGATQPAAPRSGSTRTCWRSPSRTGSGTRSTSATSPPSPACCAARRRRTRTTSASPSRGRWRGRWGTTSRCRSAGSTTATSTTAATRRPGGTTWGSSRSRSRNSCGRSLEKARALIERIVDGRSQLAVVLFFVFPDYAPISRDVWGSFFVREIRLDDGEGLRALLWCWCWCLRSLRPAIDIGK